MKRKIKLLILWTFILFIIPINILAYSEYIIPGGDNIGIEVNSRGVLIVGFYKVDGKYIAKEKGFQVGDYITKVNDKEINTIDEMINNIKDSSDIITFTINRDNEEKDIKLDYNPKDVYRTGLYVKNKILGIGTLTYIDPNTRKFGALGHEIDEKETISKFEIKDGKIFKSDVTSVKRSEDGNAGYKNANYDENIIYGNIEENEESGIFGDYLDDLPEDKKLKVADIKDIKLGEATIRTVIEDNNVEEFTINIIKINEDNPTKNFLFEVSDENLINKTGGVVQGMSGSPIIQNNMIIGAVTHVIVNDTKKGYGIFITTMLKEGDK